MRTPAAIALPVVGLLLAGCGFLMSPSGVSVTLYETGTLEVTVEGGDLPPFGAWTFEGGTFSSGYGDPASGCTNCSLEGARAVFRSSEGWELFLERFGLEPTPKKGDVALVDSRDPQDDFRVVVDDFDYTCIADPLDATSDHFAGVVTCSLTGDGEVGSPQQVRMTFEVGP